MKDIYKILIISLLAVFAYSCKSNRAKEIYRYPHASIESVLNSTDRFETATLPDWFFMSEYDKKKKEVKSYGDVRNYRFAFYNDSLFAIYYAGASPENRIPSDLIINTGKYKFSDDSIIDVYFRNTECTPEIRLFHDETNKDSIVLHLKTDEGKQLPVIKVIRWSLSLNDSIIMPERALYPNLGLWSFIAQNSTWSDSEKIGRHYPSEINIRYDYFNKPSDFCFKINLNDVQKNYLNVVDLRESPETESINDITIYYSDAEVEHRMYPEHFQLKKKGNHLILLKKDGSESDISLKILDNTVVH